MTRQIRIREELSGLDCRFDLLDARAPRHAELLWAVAGMEGAYDALHAMWTGPEISCPIADAVLPAGVDLAAMALENATSFPAAGEIALVCAGPAAFKGLPAHGFLDVGLFYGDGARLLMPMGWIMASVCAEVVYEDREALRQGCVAIRRAGTCRLQIGRVA